MNFNKKNSIATLNEAAPVYDETAVLQTEIAQRLLEHLDPIRIQPNTILDLGAKSGYTAKALRARFPDAKIVAADIAEKLLQKVGNSTDLLQQDCVCVDLDYLPFAEDVFDLVFSNLFLYFYNDLNLILPQIQKILRPNGLFLFSTFGPDTLKELRSILPSQLDYHFIDMHDIGDQLLQAGFSDPVMEMEHITLTYSQKEKLWQDLQSLGYFGFDLSQVINKTAVTFEIIYGHAWIPDFKNQTFSDEVFIPVSAIKRN